MRKKNYIIKIFKYQGNAVFNIYIIKDLSIIGYQYRREQEIRLSSAVGATWRTIDGIN